MKDVKVANSNRRGQILFLHVVRSSTFLRRYWTPSYLITFSARPIILFLSPFLLLSSWGTELFVGMQDSTLTPILFYPSAWPMSMSVLINIWQMGDNIPAYPAFEKAQQAFLS